MRIAEGWEGRCEGVSEGGDAGEEVTITRGCLPSSCWKSHERHRFVLK